MELLPLLHNNTADCPWPIIVIINTIVECHLGGVQGHKDKIKCRRAILSLGVVNTGNTRWFKFGFSSPVMASTLNNVASGLALLDGNCSQTAFVALQHCLHHRSVR